MKFSMFYSFTFPASTAGYPAINTDDSRWDYPVWPTLHSGIHWNIKQTTRHSQFKSRCLQERWCPSPFILIWRAPTCWKTAISAWENLKKPSGLNIFQCSLVQDFIWFILFRLFDDLGEGYITVERFREILREIDPTISKEELDGITSDVSLKIWLREGFRGHYVAKNGLIRPEMQRNILPLCEEGLQKDGTHFLSIFKGGKVS